MTIPSHASTWLKTLFPTGIKAMANINTQCLLIKFLIFVGLVPHCIKA